MNLPFLAKTFILALRGIPVSLEITALSLLLAVIPAYYMALARLYRVKILSRIIGVFISLVRGTPMVVQILFIYSLLPSLINAVAVRTGSSFNVFNAHPVIYAVIVFSLHASVMLSEVIRASITTVDRGQLDAAYALGMNRSQAFRLIIMPQAVVEAVPNLGTLTVNLFKETSLSFLMTVQDITAIAKIEASYGYNYIEAYIDIFIIYLIMCSLIQLVFYTAEKVVSKK
ncbi:MAG TPA: amino acid ABC transporter permease [Treponema sp.]|nr:amino acid ABC transporter permease [Treponema sp.]